jgi:hypothetical protein
MTPTTSIMFSFSFFNSPGSYYRFLTNEIRAYIFDLLNFENAIFLVELVIVRNETKALLDHEELLYNLKELFHIEI